MTRLFSRAPRPRAVSLDTALAAGRLGPWSIAMFSQGAAAPLMVVSGVVTTGYAVTDHAALPAAFVAILAVLAVFAVGFVAMAQRVSNAGALYTYIAHGLGKVPAVAAAWVALVAYYTLQVGIYGAAGAIGAPLLNDWFGLDLPWWVPAVVVWAVVGVLGVASVDLNRLVLGVLLAAELVVIAVFTAASVAHPADGSVSLDGLAPTGLASTGVGAVLALAVLGFIGAVEQPVVYTEESRHGGRTIRTATYLSLGIVGVLYPVATWAMTQATGPDQIAARSRAEGPELLFTLAGQHLGRTWAEIGHVLVLTSIAAAAISFHNACARYGFALGRERVLPQRLGRTNRAGAPKWASLTQSTFGAVVIAAYALADLDPLVHLFFYAGTAGALGVLMLLAATSFAVYRYFRAPGGGGGGWQRVIAPSLATVALVWILALAVQHFDVLLGVAPDHWLRWTVPAAYAAVAMLGAGWALILRDRRPDIYKTIGLGAQAATAGIIAPKSATSPTRTSAVS